MATNYGTFSYPGSVSSSPSTGSNGSTAPTFSTEVGGINPSGNLQPLQTTADGALIVSQDSTTIFNENVAQFGGGNVVTGVGNSGAGIPRVTVSSDSSITNITGTVSLPTGAATQTTLATVSTTLGSILLDLTNGTQTTQINGTVPLPTGASTSALQTTGNTSLASIDTKTPALGQTTMALSQPVTIASNQTAIPTTDNTLDTYITGAGPATAVINTNVLLAVTGTAALDLQGSRSIAFQIVTGAATTAVAVDFEASNDNVNFVAVAMYDKTTPTAAPVTTFTTAASTVRYFEGPTEFRYFRVRLVAAITAGTIQAFTIARSSTYQMTNNSLAAGTQAIGSVTVASGTLTAVTAITNALPAGTNVIGFTKQGGRSQSFVPVQNVYTTTAVTTATYLQLVASTTTAVTYLDIFDSSGQAMILATGASGSEVILAYIPPGGDQIAVTIPISTRIAIKALTATAAAGYLLLNGYN